MKTFDINKTEQLALIQDELGIRYTSILDAGELQSIAYTYLRQMHCVASHAAVGLYLVNTHHINKFNWQELGRYKGLT